MYLAMDALRFIVRGSLSGGVMDKAEDHEAFQEMLVRLETFSQDCNYFSIETNPR